jgi:serine-type D-Ala-D-Ala carboxypeptidase/endopeptidase (penicillin-binding protein 4)
VNRSVAVIGGKIVEMDDPATFAASELTRLLRARGVAVAANGGHAAAPAGAATVASVRSQPLSTIVAWMFKTSDNLAAELLTKELGVRERRQGTTAAGVDVTRSTLRDLGVVLNGQTMIDGSGLDRGNRLTCRILAAVVKLGTRPALSALQAGLPLAPASFDGRVHAKGGYLTDVTGLTGTVSGTDALTFSFLANGGVPIKAKVDVAQFTAVLSAYQPPALLSDTVVSTP